MRVCSWKGGYGVEKDSFWWFDPRGWLVAGFSQVFALNTCTIASELGELARSFSGIFLNPKFITLDPGCHLRCERAWCHHLPFFLSFAPSSETLHRERSGRPHDDMWMPFWICLQEKSPDSWRDLAEKRALSARRPFFFVDGGNF